MKLGTSSSPTMSALYGALFSEGNRFTCIYSDAPNERERVIAIEARARATKRIEREKNC